MKPEDLAKLRIDRSMSFRAIPAAGRKRGLRVALVLTLALAGAAGYWVLAGKAPAVRTVQAALVFPSQTCTLLNATGYVVPQTKADVASKATGRLERLDVVEGQSVRKDEIIARIENRDLVANMNQAAANLAVAKADAKKAEAELWESGLARERAQTLVEKKFISRSSYDTERARYDRAAASVGSARAAIAAAEAGYSAARVAVDYTLIRAPFDGVILEKHADIGDIVAPLASATQSKGSVVSMADLSTLEVEADVAESNLSGIRTGQPCEVRLDALPEQRFRCAVDRIVPTVDRSKATVLVKVRFVDRDERILPDMSAKVAFLSRELSADELRPVTAVPAAAVIRRDGADAVFRIEGKRVRVAPIETGGRLGEQIVVKAGVGHGDSVVIEPPPGLRDGAEIRTQTP